jgi:hypothetical protein
MARVLRKWRSARSSSWPDGDFRRLARANSRPLLPPVLHLFPVFGLLRTLITIAFLSSLVYCGATVKLGNRTFFGHVSRIWSSDETQEMVNGVKESSDPVVDKIKRGVKAGYQEVSRDATIGDQP